MTVQTDLRTALDAYIQANFSGGLAQISAEKLNLEELLGILETVTPVTLSGNVTIDNVGITSSVLPTGASTSVKQDTGNTSLSNLDTKIGEVAGSPTANTVLARLKAIADALVFGVKAAANSISIAPASDAVFSVTQAPTTPAYLFTATITRPADVLAYTANSVYVGVIELISSVAPTAGQWIIITDIEIIFNIAALPSGMAGFQLYTYNVAPPSATANRGAFSLPSGDRSAIIYPNGLSLGNAALARGGGSVVCQVNNINVLAKLTGTSLFSYLVTTGAFTPAANSETATIRVRAIAV